MKRTRSAAVAAVALSLVLAHLPAAAHDVYWTGDAATDTLVSGHLPGQTHGGEAPAPLDAKWVAWLATVDERGELRPLPVPDAAPVTVAADGVAVFALLDWGWWTKTAEGRVNSHPSQVAAPLQSWRSQATVKHLRRWHARLAAPLGRGLEITPLTDPLPSAEGDKLTFLVTLDGTPVADAAVAYGGETRGATGPDGRVNIRLREAGLQMLNATLRRPEPSVPDAQDVRSAVLTFVLEAR
ncbi:MAG: DUF4198 domain-containing protein [bacterium]|nr:DUF4198 domain-containing protein [bacterium]